jgi:YVTN family beta-propeller protein
MVSIVDAATLNPKNYNPVTSVIHGLGDPHGIAVSPDGSTVYVTNTADNVVEVIDAATAKVTGTIPVGQLPWGLALSAKGGTLYVADPDSNQVSVISTATDTVTSTISLAGGPDTLALTPDGSQLWICGAHLEHPHGGEHVERQRRRQPQPGRRRRQLRRRHGPDGHRDDHDAHPRRKLGSSPTLPYRPAWRRAVRPSRRSSTPNSKR